MTLTDSDGPLALEERVRGALWGSLVSDAFCLGSHWIYSLNEIDQHFPGGIRGFEAPSREHYHFGKQSGDFTHYGDAALLMLSSIARQGRFEAKDFGASFIGMMSSEDYGGYRDHATKGTLSNYFVRLESGTIDSFDYQQGADDDQPATVTRLAPVVAVHFTTAEFLDIVAKATRVCQNNSRAIAYSQAFALVLSNLFQGFSPEDAVAETRKALESPDPNRTEVNRRMKVSCAARILSPIDATMLFGQSCQLYSSFTAALHTMLTCSDDFVHAIQVTANAGGDSAGRAAMIGAWLGAHLGLQAIPEEWRRRLIAHDRIKTDVEKIVTRMKQPIL